MKSKQNNELIEKVYPKHVQYISNITKAGKVNHAYCIVGTSEGGQDSLLDYWIDLLLCPSSCGSCLNCVERDKQIHVDVMDYDSNNQQILIENTRAISKHISSKPVLSAYRIAIIRNAHLLTKAAANSLLKLIEEPPKASRILLSTSQLDLLPATIKSRLQVIHLPAVSRRQIYDMVKEQSGASGRECDIEADNIAGKFIRLSEYLRQGEQISGKWRKDNEFWLNFLKSDIVEREKVLNSALSDNDDAGSILNSLENALHDIFLAVYKVHSDHESGKRGVNTNTVVKQIEKIGELRKMNSHNLNRKLLFDYLVFGL